jgi:hypothetical protein
MRLRSLSTARTALRHDFGRHPGALVRHENHHLAFRLEKHFAW